MNAVRSKRLILLVLFIYSKSSFALAGGCYELYKHDIDSIFWCMHENREYKEIRNLIIKNYNGSNDPIIIKYRGISSYYLGDSAGAVRDLKKIVGDSESVVYLSRAYRVVGDKDAAIAVLVDYIDEIVSVFPGFPPAETYRKSDSEVLVYMELSEVYDHYGDAKKSGILLENGFLRNNASKDLYAKLLSHLEKYGPEESYSKYRNYTNFFLR